MKYGGIYLDYDVVVLQSSNSLQKYPITLCKERHPKLNTGIIIVYKECMFLRIW